MITINVKFLQFIQSSTLLSRFYIDKNTIKIFVKFIKNIKINQTFKNSEEYKIVAKKFAYFRIFDKKNQKIIKRILTYIFINNYKVNLT